MAKEDDKAEPEAAWVDFLNVDGAGFARALGYRLQGLESAGTKVLVLCAGRVRAEALNAGLWTFDQASFLPHGGINDGAPGDHPIWVHHEEPSSDIFPADMIISVDDSEPADWNRYSSRWRVFDARDPVQRDIGRTRWLAWRKAGQSMAYWTFEGSEWRLERRG